MKVALRAKVWSSWRNSQAPSGAIGGNSVAQRRTPGLALCMDPCLGTCESGELKNPRHGTVRSRSEQQKGLSMQEFMAGDDLPQAL